MLDFKKFKGIIFDLDGTLIDSMWIWEKIDVDFLGKRGFEVPKDYLDKITPMGVDACAEYTIERFNLNEKKEDIIKEWFDMAIDAYSNHVELKPGVVEFINYLKDNNIKMSIATASDKELVIPVLENNGIIDYFDNITTVREAKRGKGFPDVYDVAAKKMGFLNNECVVFEDIEEGLTGAKIGGYTTVGVYDKRNFLKEEKLRSLCDLFIYDFKECIV